MSINTLLVASEQYMSASDCIVTKAGPGTVAEAAIKGLPVILSCFLPGQDAVGG